MEISLKLIILLIIFSLVMFFITIYEVRKKKLSIKNSLLWFFTSFIIFILALFPKIVLKFTNLIGFETTSNMIVGIMFVLLLWFIMLLTIVVTKQKEMINLLIQEVSILKSESGIKKNEKKR